MTRVMKREISNLQFYKDIKKILAEARNKAYAAVNFVMVEAYWNVGGRIVEEEQEGRHKAEYGEYLIQNLSKRLTKEFGAGFTEQNLRNFRQFYLIFLMRRFATHCVAN